MKRMFFTKMAISQHWGRLTSNEGRIQHFTDRQSWLNDYKCLKNALYGYFCGHVINICPQLILSIGKTMIKRDTDVEVVSKATTNQRIGRSNVKPQSALPSSTSVDSVCFPSSQMPSFLQTMPVANYVLIVWNVLYRRRRRKLAINM